MVYKARRKMRTARAECADLDERLKANQQDRKVMTDERADWQREFMRGQPD